MLMAGWDGAEMLRVGTALTAGGNAVTSSFCIRTMSAVVDARTREESRREPDNRLRRRLPRMENANRSIRVR